MTRRAIICVLDSLGIGAADDAGAFGDSGADTLGHIAMKCAEGEGDRSGVRSGTLRLPHLARLGLGAAARSSTGRTPPGLESTGPFTGMHGYAVEQGHGKDTPGGHWEIAGVPVMFDWGYFPDRRPAFPLELTEALVERAGLPGILGNCHASGTRIIADLGAEHLRTGKPICYTSADSVFQIAAHEEAFGLERLYALCETAFELMKDYHVARVIARPFLGDGPENFARTANRRDLTVPPPEPTLLDVLTEAGGEVVAIGKISDIFAGRGISRKIKAHGNMALFDATLIALDNAPDRSLVFTNFVDFDMLWGHRRDVVGYAAGLEAFDARLPELEARLQPGDMVLFTADHGCDPTWRGTDHTREHVPVLAFGPGLPVRDLGRRDFTDMGASIADWLGLPPLSHGSSWL
jgi:phosphopentomutase